MFTDIEVGFVIELTIKQEGTFKGTVCGFNQESIWVQDVELIHNDCSVIQSKKAIVFYCHEIKNLKIKEVVA